MFCVHSKQLTMITGDNPLTACHVARELRLTRREIVVLTPPEKTNDHGMYIDLHITTEPLFLTVLVQATVNLVNL